IKNPRYVLHSGGFLFRLMHPPCIQRYKVSHLWGNLLALPTCSFILGSCCFLVLRVLQVLRPYSMRVCDGLAGATPVLQVLQLATTTAWRRRKAGTSGFAV
ncbi:MAG: hypothetical protein RR365_14940, partial [Bacteroides sp.]